MTDDVLDELERLHRATGPDAWVDEGGYRVVVAGDVALDAKNFGHVHGRYHDTEFAAAAHEAMPFLLAEVRRLRALEATAVERVEMATASERIAAAAMKRSALAERPAEAVLAWHRREDIDDDVMTLADAIKALTDAYRKARGQ